MKFVFVKYVYNVLCASTKFLSLKCALIVPEQRAIGIFKC